MIALGEDADGKSESHIIASQYSDFAETFRMVPAMFHVMYA